MIGEFSIKALGGGTCLCSENFFQALFSQTFIFALMGHFQELQLNNGWPISVKFGEILEKYIINKSVSGNSIILKILSLKAISVRSLRMIFSQF